MDVIMNVALNIFRNFIYLAAAGSAKFRIRIQRLSTITAKHKYPSDFIL